MAHNGYIQLIGKTRIGETLQAKVHDADGVSNIHYQWFANGKAIHGATQNTLHLNASHVGKQISVQASYTDRSGSTETPVSDYSPAIMDKPAALPAYKAAAGQPTVSISGTSVVKEGQKATYTVKLDKAAREDVSVDIEIVHGSSNSLDAAISHDIQRVIIKKGQTAATFTVDTFADGVAEGRETYQVRISQAKLGAIYEESATSPSPVSKQSTILVSYSYPHDGAANPYWSAVHGKGSGKIPMVLVNPNSGPGTHADANYVKLVNANTGAGFKNIAYIKTVYGSRSLDEVKADIDTYFKLYGKKNIHGFFFDEIGTQSNHQIAYMAEIYNHVKIISPQLTVMANPGWHIPDAIAPYADIFVTGEMSANNYLNHYHPATSAFENSAANAKHIMHMVYGADPSQYDKILQLSRERNAGWIFITSDDQTHPHYNPYDELPRNFSRLIDKSHLGMPDSPIGTAKAPPAAIHIGTATASTAIVDTLADTTPPHIKITADKTTLKTGESANLTFTPSEAIKDFDWQDVKISGTGYLMHFRPAGNGTYTAQLKTYGSGKVDLSIAPESFADLAGNKNSAAAPLTFNVLPQSADTTRPHMKITADKTTLKAGESANLTFTPSETIKDFDWQDVKISGNGYLLHFRPTGDGKYTAQLKTYGSGKVDLSIAPESFADLAGNKNAANTPLTFNVLPQSADTTRPHITVSADKTTLKTGESANLIFTPSEAIQNFDWNDVRISKGGYLMNFRPIQGGKYAARLVTYDSGDVKLTIPAGTFSDKAGNQNTATAPLTFNVAPKIAARELPALNTPAKANAAPKILSITAGRTQLKEGEETQVTFKLSEKVKNFEWNDVYVTEGGRLKNFEKINDTTYTGTFRATKAGTVRLIVKPGSFSDMQHLQNQTEESISLNIGKTQNPPAANANAAPKILSITAARTQLKEGEETQITFKLSEKVKNFEWNDVYVTAGGRLKNLTKIDETTYTGTFRATKAGTVRLIVKPGSFSDMEHLQNQTEASINLQVQSARDTTPPVLTISSEKSTLHPGETTTLTFSLSEPVRNFAANDLVVKGGRLNGELKKINDTTYTAEFTAGKSGTASIKVPAGGFSDITAGNQNRESHFSIKVTEPAITISGDTRVNEGASANYTVKLSQANDDSDVVVNVRLKSDSGSINTLQQVIIPKGQTSATISGKLPAGSHLNVQEFTTIDQLLKANLKPGDTVRLTGHNNPGDVKVLYTITDTPPNAESTNKIEVLLSKVTIKLANGKYARPDISDTYLPADNTKTQVEQFINIGKTYTTEKEAAFPDPNDPKKILYPNLIWSDKVNTPLSDPEATIHENKSNMVNGKFGLTCSTFVGMVMSAWKYSDTTYVKEKNHETFTWGTTFDVPTDLPKKHIGADQLLKYLYLTDRTAFYQPGKTELQEGDIIFFSNPEKYAITDKNNVKHYKSDIFMNAYHVGIYMGNGEIMHSAGPYHNDRGGVVIEKIHHTIIPDISFIARPRLTEKELFQIEIPDDHIARNDTLNLSVYSASGAKPDGNTWKIQIVDNDIKPKQMPELPQVHFNDQVDAIEENDTDNTGTYSLQEENLPQLPDAASPATENASSPLVASTNTGLSFLIDETPLSLAESAPQNAATNSSSLTLAALLAPAENPLAPFAETANAAPPAHLSQYVAETVAAHPLDDPLPYTIL